MSNTHMERWTNMNFCDYAHGDVLIGGLGIGLIILAIQDNPEVHSITVIEKNQEVIDMVATQLPLNEKVKIIQADVFLWKPQRGVQYDTIYMDIWPWLDSHTYQEEMLPLKRKFAHYLKIHPPHSRDFSRELGGWVLCVLRDFLCSDDQKVLSAKMPSGNIFHTDGVTIFGKETAA